MGDLYASFMDEARAEKLGIRADRGTAGGRGRHPDQGRPRSHRGRAGEVRHLRPAGLLRRHRREEFGPVYSRDLKPGLGLPDRDYYWDAKFKTKLAAYQAYIGRMLTLAKIGGGTAGKAAAADIVALETRIAKVQWSKVREPQRRQDLQ